ncbi:hypothetical protein GQX74_006629 [Glossina fuscipes]|nr:hypothetical protein GQX74_006629 [Glossina fuscipes]
MTADGLCLIYLVDVFIDLSNRLILRIPSYEELVHLHITCKEVFSQPFCRLKFFLPYSIHNYSACGCNSFYVVIFSHIIGFDMLAKTLCAHLDGQTYIVMQHRDIVDLYPPLPDDDNPQASKGIYAVTERCIYICFDVNSNLLVTPTWICKIDTMYVEFVTQPPLKSTQFCTKFIVMIIIIIILSYATCGNRFQIIPKGIELNQFYNYIYPAMRYDTALAITKYENLLTKLTITRKLKLKRVKGDYDATSSFLSFYGTACLPCNRAVGFAK